MKTILIILIGVILTLLAVNYHNRQQRDNYIEQVTELNTLNKQLRVNITDRDLLIEKKDGRILVLDDSLKDVKEQLARKQAEFIALEVAYDDLEENMSTIPTEESYRILQEEIYPFAGEMKYPFNQKQVQGIHLTFLQWRQQDWMLGNLKGQISYYTKEINLQELVNKELKGTILIMQENRVDSETIIMNQNVLITTHRDQITRERRRKTLWQIATGLAIGAAVIF